jgi:hypothetical protein
VDIIKGEAVMNEKSKIRFNPVTREFEIEGSEGFVKEYFSIIQSMISESGRKISAVKKIAALPGSLKRVTNTETILNLIKGNKVGISVTELKSKTGLEDKQIWAVVYKAERQNKVKKAKRGVYVGV